MKRIIADTNIWYEIERDEVLKLKENNFQLVVPIIVLNELYTSPKIQLSNKSFNYTKKAIKSILDNLDCIEFVDLNPFEYLIKDIFPGIVPKNNHNFYLSEFKAIIKLNHNDVKNIPPKRVDISSLTNFINTTSISYRKEINKHKVSKDNFAKLVTINKTKELIIKYTNDNLETVGNYPKLEKLNPENELFATIFDNLLRTVSKTGTKLKNNDWVDIFLLSYVGQQDLYWTKEISKLNLFKFSNFENQIYKNSYC